MEEGRRELASGLLMTYFCRLYNSSAGVSAQPQWGVIYLGPYLGGGERGESECVCVSVCVCLWHLARLSVFHHSWASGSVVMETGHVSEQLP